MRMPHPGMRIAVCGTSGAGEGGPAARVGAKLFYGKPGETLDGPALIV